MRDLLDAAAGHAATYLESLSERPVRAEVGPTAARDKLSGVLGDEPVEPGRVLDELVAAAEPGITAMSSPRFFGFVNGGALPAALASDWIATAWDQNAGLAAPAPSIAVIEEIAGAWLIDLFGLPADASFAFVTGCQMAHVTALAAARNGVLAGVDWDVERDGLIGAPQIRVLVGEERHVTVDKALRVLGLGTACIDPIAVDERGAMRPQQLAERLRGKSGPTIVCAQAGNVNTGAVDPLDAICDSAHEVGAWVHVDAAFGLWANASPRYRGLLRGSERADSWATDAHKWLNVPYDCGMAFVADPEPHRRAMTASASYLRQAEGVRQPLDWNPEASRRARSLPVYAALRSLGRSGVNELVDRLCACAERFAEGLEELPGIQVLAQDLNQTLVRLHPDSAVSDRLVEEIQREGTCWMGPTTWHEMRCMRISVCNWQTTFEDVDRSVEAIARVVAGVPAAR